MNGKERISFDVLVDQVRGLKESIDKVSDKQDMQGERLSAIETQVTEIKSSKVIQDERLEKIGKSVETIQQWPKFGRVILMIVGAFGGLALIRFLIEKGQFLFKYLIGKG